jgi:hypothetical protein
MVSDEETDIDLFTLWTRQELDCRKGAAGWSASASAIILSRAAKEMNRLTLSLDIWLARTSSLAF